MTANAIDMTTVADVKAWLGVTAITDDALIQRLITAASNYLQQVLSRDIVSTTYTAEIYHGRGGPDLMLRNWPITAVSAIIVNDQTGSTLSTYGAADCWTDGRSVYLLNGNVFVKGRGNVSVTYTAGYTTATVPFPLAQATIELVAVRYSERSRIGHVSKSLGGETVTFSVLDMPNSVKTIIKQMQNVVPV